MKLIALVLVGLISSVACEWVKSSERRVFKGLKLEELRSIMRPLEKADVKKHHPSLNMENITLP